MIKFAAGFFLIPGCKATKYIKQSRNYIPWMWMFLNNYQTWTLQTQSHINIIIVKEKQHYFPTSSGPVSSASHGWARQPFISSQSLASRSIGHRHAPLARCRPQIRRLQLLWAIRDFTNKSGKWTSSGSNGINRANLETDISNLIVRKLNPTMWEFPPNCGDMPGKNSDVPHYT